MLDTGSCLLLSNIPVCGYTQNILSIHLLMDVCIVSSIWLLWMRPLLLPLHNLCVKYALFLLGKYVGTELLGHMVSVGLYVNLLKKLSNCFLKCLYCYQDFSFFWLFSSWQGCTLMWLSLYMLCLILSKLLTLCGNDFLLIWKTSPLFL